MKSIVGQIILKDTRRLWSLLVLWALALAVRAVLPAWMEWGNTAGREEGMFSMLLVLLVNAQLAAKVLAEDSPVKEAAFWRTRPIGGGQMLKAKLLFLGGWTLVLPALVMVASAVGYGFTAGEAARTIAGQLVFHALIGLIFFVVSIFTERVWSSLLMTWLVLTVGAALLSAARLGGAGGSGAGAGEALPGMVAVSLTATRWMLAVSVVLAAVGLAAWWVYRDRRRVAAGIAITLGVAAAKGVLSVWPFDLLGGVSALRALDAQADPAVRATMATADGHSSGATLDDVRYRSVGTQVSWSGMADGHVCIVYRVEGTLTWPGGGQWRGVRKTEANAMEGVSDALRAMGVEKFPGGGRVGLASAYVTLAQIPETELAKHGSIDAEWRGRIWARIGRIEPEWRMPLRLGARFAHGASRAGIETRAIEGGRLRLGIFARAPDQPRWSLAGDAADPLSAWPFFLVNSDRGEFVRAEGGGSRGTHDGLFHTQSWDVSFTPPRTESVAEWLGGAELVRLRFVEERRVVTEASARVFWAPAR